MLNLHRLMVLHQFALRGSISATAEALDYSPSAVSQQLSALERETGISLLERTARSALLTDAGRLLAQRAADLMAAAETAEAELHASVDEISGSVTVSVIPTVAPHVAAELARLAATTPRLELVLRQAESADALQLLEQSDVDVAVVDLWPPQRTITNPRLRARTLIRDRLVVATALDHSLATDTSTVTLKDLAPHVAHDTWLCAPHGHPSRRGIDGLLREYDLEPVTRWEFEGLNTIASLVAQGAGIAILPRLALGGFADTIHTRDLRPAAHRTIEAVTRSSAHRRPAVTATLAAVRQGFASA